MREPLVERLDISSRPSVREQLEKRGIIDETDDILDIDLEERLSDYTKPSDIAEAIRNNGKEYR